jgi:hypothetical protein
MEAKHILGTALGYLGGGVVWFLVSEHFLPASTVLRAAPPGGATGQIVLWPWGVASYIYSKVKE